MLIGKSTAALALAVSLAVPAVASAQYGDTGDSERPTIHVFGHLGAAQITRDLSPSNMIKQDAGMAFGLGAGMQFAPSFALRAYFDASPAEGAGLATSDVYGRQIDRYFYGIDIQGRYVTEMGVAPYLTLGLGAVSVSVEDGDSFTKGAGKAGLGVAYLPKSGPLSYFAQGNVYVYGFDAHTYIRDQVDMLWTVGVKYNVTR